MSEVIIDNIFQIKNGDILQICEDGLWSDLGRITDARGAAMDMYHNNFIIDGKPARVIRREVK